MTTYKAFVHSLMEYCSPIWTGAPASQLSRLHAVETKAFRIVGNSRGEAESLGLSLSHRRQVGGLCLVLSPLRPRHPLLCLRYVPHIFPQGASRSASNPCLVKLPKSRKMLTFTFFIPLFFPPLEQTPTLSSIPLFHPSLQNSCSPPSLFFPHPKPRSFLLPLIHPKPTSFKFPAFLSDP